MAIQTLAGIAQHDQNSFARIAASNALLDRGWGRPRSDEPDGREHINITIRKILEGVVVETTAPSSSREIVPVTIDHDPTESNDDERE
jgi:hypothetical protein